MCLHPRGKYLLFHSSMTHCRRALLLLKTIILYTLLKKTRAVPEPKLFPSQKQKEYENCLSPVEPSAALCCLSSQKIKRSPKFQVRYVDPKTGLIYNKPPKKQPIKKTPGKRET